MPSAFKPDASSSILHGSHPGVCYRNHKREKVPTFSSITGLHPGEEQTGPVPNRESPSKLLHPWTGRDMLICNAGMMYVQCCHIDIVQGDAMWLKGSIKNLTQEKCYGCNLLAWLMHWFYSYSL